jgi:hypothetical protein
LKKLYSILFFAFFSSSAFSQPTTFSLATDLSLQRSFKKEQRYWAVGQTVHFHFHFTPKDGAYAWVSYYSTGKFSNTVTAVAKSIVTIPSELAYRNNAEMRIKHISLGWKRYLKGSPNSETWNLYGYAGFGLLMGRVINTHEPVIDTAVYTVPVRSGKGNFTRLTFDLGLGGEIHIGGDIYIYLEARALVPTTDYPSKHLLINDNAPFMGAANAGVRVFFD